MEIKVCRHRPPGSCKESDNIFTSAGFGGFPGGFPGGAAGPFGSGDFSSLGNMAQTVRNQNSTLLPLYSVQSSKCVNRTKNIVLNC